VHLKEHVRALFVNEAVLTTTKGEATRARILETAATQASQSGYNATSLADVAAATGLSKSAVFKHFQSKDALLLALIEDISARFAALAWLPPKHDHPPGLARLQAIFEAWLQWADASYWPGGCPLMVAASEFANQAGPVHDAIRDMQALWIDTLAREFSRADPPASDPKVAAFEMNGIVMSYNYHRRLLQSPNARPMAAAAFSRLIAGPAV
jgi:AcrR family transcriptional regulator